MLSTPLNVSYFDNPDHNLVYIGSLDPEQTKIYTLGYIQACHHVQEALGESKRRLLTAALDIDEDNEKLLSHVKLLDSLDVSLDERVKFLKNNWPDQDL